MKYQSDTLLPLSAIQHLLYCERQCALIHVEQQWVENQHTVAGRFFHDRAHSGTREVRGEQAIEFGVSLRSERLGLFGTSDAVEFHYETRLGSKLRRVVPIEYKSGRPKQGDHDRVQLCAQGMALEEMMSVTIEAAAVYYGKTRHRTWVDLHSGLREQTATAARRLHELVESGFTPVAEYEKAKCGACSLFDICKPRSLLRVRSVSAYTEKQVRALLSEQDP